MSDTLFHPPSTSRPALPEPRRERWHPLRLGLVDLFHYDSEEFWFHDGHLLLRGNNGTGKSKVLSLTLPFLFDAQLRSSRVEPDGDSGKKMAWNLLMNVYPRRIGYTWIEFGRRQADGTALYLTLGAGLFAVAGKTQVDSWFFLLEGAAGQDPRIGQDVWMTSEQRVVLTRERLREVVEGQGRGKVFDNAQSYRRAVDERLFHLGAKRYEALMDTLIQLRQPQLSRKPDEAGLSLALTEALPPMPSELLADVAEALNQLEELPLEELAELPPAQMMATATALRDVATKRHESIRYLERRHANVDAKQGALKTMQAAQRERRAELEEAAQQRAAADQHAEAAGKNLIDAWTSYCSRLMQLSFDAEEAMAQLVVWTAAPKGPNPIHAALSEAYRQASVRHAGRHSELETRRKGLQYDRIALVEEKDRLAAGDDVVPPPPLARGANAREGRAGAPLWQLVDFQPHVQAQHRAGLEAALEASGLLDAWITPDGTLTDANGAPIWDVQWLRRPGVQGDSLLSQLVPVVPESSPISLQLLEALLACVACAAVDDNTSESWVSDDGRYRLGALTGAWNKPEAVYIGHTARAQARERRLHEISLRLQELDAEDALLSQDVAVLETEQEQAKSELRDAPSDDPLRTAVLNAAGAERAVLQARSRLDMTDAQCRTAETELQAERQLLESDAADLKLPVGRADLPPIVSAVDRFKDLLSELVQSARTWSGTWLDSIQQQEREAEARSALAQREKDLATANDRAETARSRYAVLHESIGAKVETLRQQLAQAADDVNQAEGDVNNKQKTLTKRSEERGIADVTTSRAEQLLADFTAARTQAVERLQRFTESTLLASALPELPVPDRGIPWTIDPALQLARRAEQLLGHVSDDEVSWSRVQRQISEDLTELQRSLSALGHQATSEPNDWGFTVHVLYQNRSERPDALAAHLADDIAQRSELLSVREREVLENHLQAEIAAEIQRLMRAADKQVASINDELHKRPTSTGVRFRLQWQPLSQEEGAPVGLEIARERLLNTSSDLWSADDRRTVGTMLQQQIAKERARAESDATASGLSLIDQLAQALDYRRWHRFRVQRQQDGQWRKLSGPASSGERALGLTVPLFAAISSFYGQGVSPHAPRLMLLDEAFAGIDDAARAHCMGLIHEFDLDFVITSEREWACYAELPGVSICQLQRREGVDAVYVSRWTWDGRAKRREDDPDRRFPIK